VIPVRGLRDSSREQESADQGLTLADEIHARLGHLAEDVYDVFGEGIDPGDVRPGDIDRVPRLQRRKAAPVPPEEIGVQIDRDGPAPVPLPTQDAHFVQERRGRRAAGGQYNVPEVRDRLEEYRPGCDLPDHESPGC
jgi:hypothetical protein